MLDMLCNYLTETKKMLGGITLPSDGPSPSKKAKAAEDSSISFYGGAKKPAPVPETKKHVGSVAPSNSGGGRAGQPKLKTTFSSLLQMLSVIT